MTPEQRIQDLLDALDALPPLHRSSSGEQADACLRALALALNARPALKALVARLELADRMFALFEEYHGTGRAEAYADMVDAYHAYRAAKEPNDA